MSESLSHDPSMTAGSHLPPTEAMPAIPPTPETRASEVIEEVQMAYHSLRARISERKRERAGDRMERMDHKQALYTDLGSFALNGERTNTPTATGEPARPRTFAERFMDRRLDKKGEKKAIADVYARRAEKIFGPKDEEPGLTKNQRRLRKAGVSWAGHKGASAGNVRRAKNRIDAAPVKHGEGMHKRTGKNQARATDRLEKSAIQPRLSRWRAHRREEAIGDIQKHHARAEARKAKIEEIQHKRYERDMSEGDLIRIPREERHRAYDWAEEEDD